MCMYIKLTVSYRTGGDIKCRTRKIDLLVLGVISGCSLSDYGPLAEYKNANKATSLASKYTSEKNKDLLSIENSYIVTYICV